MNVFASLILSLIAAAGDDGSALAMDDQLPHAVEIMRCNFEQSIDRNYDAWPDGWTRRRGREFPAFLKIGILPELKKENEGLERYLQMELSGGSAAVVTPLYTLGARGSFFLEGRVRTKGLKHDHAYLTLTFYDEHGTPLESYDSNRIIDAPDWKTLRIGPVLPKHETATQARVTLTVGPQAEAEDLSGTVQWTGLKMVRLPRIALRVVGDLPVYDSLTAAEVVCEVSGLVGARPELRFELLDTTDRVLASSLLPLTLNDKVRRPTKVTGPKSRDELATVVVNTNSEPQAGITGNARWKPPVPDFGYYRVRVSMQGMMQDHEDEEAPPHVAGPTILQRTMSLAFLRPLPRAPGGEFGWSLPSGEDPLPLNPLATLLGQSGLGWAKYPVWFGEKEQEQADRLAWFAERLSIHGIEFVGVLDQPPKSLRDTIRDKGRLPSASVFQEPQMWQPAVDPVMTRLSLKVRWWQLGDDRDTSYVDFPNLEQHMLGIKKHFERFGQQVHLGFGWRWLRDPPSSAATPPWEFLSYSAEPELTAAELTAYLQMPKAAPKRTVASTTTTPVSLPARLSVGATPAAPTPGSTATAPPPAAHLAAPRNWIVLTPLPRSQYNSSARVLDLVQRMLAARQQGSAVVFIPQPFSDETGLLNADGSPGELYVPWRTTATLLGGTQYLGSLPLPGGSVNHAFAREGHTCMVLWNDTPTKETFFLGEDVRHLDLWGRELKLASKATNEQGDDRIETTVEVGPEPTFVLGLDEGLTRWQIRARFETTHLESVFGRQQPVTLHLENAFPQGVSGSAVLHAPKAWNIAPQPLQFRLAEGETVTPDWFVSLQPDAASGPQRVRIDFEIIADKNYKFSIYRTLKLGLDDVTVEMRTRIREDGLLLVEQTLTNLTGRPISFNCLLFPPGRRRETKQLLHLPAGRHTITFVIPQGEALLGQKLWLRAEEIGGPRVLNSDVVVER